jgi:hypothetical protein
MSQRSRPTKDSAPNVCYTNIVAIADLLVGPAAGFQDEAPNVDNFLLQSAVTQNAHNDMLADAAALQKMHAGLTWACQPGPTNKQLIMNGDARMPSAEDEAAENAFKNAIAGGQDDDEEDDDRRSGRQPKFGANSGCSSSASSRTTTTFGSAFGGLFLGLVVVLSRRRAISDRGRATR